MRLEEQFAVLVEHAAEIDDICKKINHEIINMIFLLNEVKQTNFNTICLINKVGNLNYIYEEVAAVIKINFINNWIPELEGRLNNIRKQMTQEHSIDISNLNFTLKNKFEFIDLHVYIENFCDNFIWHINDFKKFLNEHVIFTRSFVDNMENINFFGTVTFFPKNIIIGHPDYKFYRNSYNLITETKAQVTTIINYLHEKKKILLKNTNSNLHELRKMYISFNNIFLNNWQNNFEKLILFTKAKISASVTNLKNKSLNFENELKLLFERILVENTSKIIPKIETSVTTIINETKNTTTFLSELLQNLFFNRNDKNCCDEKLSLIAATFNNLETLITYKIIELKVVINNFETYLNPLYLTVTNNNFSFETNPLTILVAELTEIINFNTNIKKDYYQNSQTTFEFNFFDDFNYNDVRAWLDKKVMLTICHLTNKKILNDTERFEKWTNSHFPNLQELMRKDLHLNMQKFFTIMENFEITKDIILDNYNIADDILVTRLNNEISQMIIDLTASINFLSEKQHILNKAIEIDECNNHQIRAINDFKNDYYRSILRKKNPQQVILKFFKQTMAVKNINVTFSYKKNRYLEEGLIILFDNTAWNHNFNIDNTSNVNFANIEAWFNNKEKLDICNLDKNFVDGTNKNRNEIKFLTKKTNEKIIIWKNNFLQEITNVFINRYLFQNKKIQTSVNYTKILITNFINNGSVTSIHEIEDFKNFECDNFIKKIILIIDNIVELWKQWQSDDNLEECYQEQISQIANIRQELFYKIISNTILPINTCINKIKTLKTNLDKSALIDFVEEYEIEKQYEQLTMLVTHIDTINILAIESQEEFNNISHVNYMMANLFYSNSNFSICNLNYNLERIKSNFISNENVANFDWDHLFLEKPEFSLLTNFPANTNDNAFTNHWFLYVFLMGIVLLVTGVFCNKYNKKRKKKNRKKSKNSFNKPLLKVDNPSSIEQKIIKKQDRKHKNTKKKNVKTIHLNIEEQMVLTMPSIAEPTSTNNENFATINLATVNKETETCFSKQQTTIQL